MSAKEKMLHRSTRDKLKAELTAMKLPNSDYIIADISDEEWREVETSERTYRIHNPKTLIIRKGGSTHRVVDGSGVVHCYVAPESGKTILRWKAKEGKSPVKF